jgi:hypothetical protein
VRTIEMGSRRASRRGPDAGRQPSAVPWAVKATMLIPELPGSRYAPQLCSDLQGAPQLSPGERPDLPRFPGSRNIGTAVSAEHELG